MEQFGLVSLSSLYQCPQCQTSLTDMSSHWRHMDTERDAWQLPQHLQEFKVKVCALILSLEVYECISAKRLFVWYVLYCSVMYDRSFPVLAQFIVAWCAFEAVHYCNC